MAVATETLIQQHPRTPVTELNEFLVPKILSVNLKKKAEHRSMNLERGGFVGSNNGGEVNKLSKFPVKSIENVQKNLSKILDNEIPSAVHLETKDLAVCEEDVNEMAPERHRDKGNPKQQSSYLLQPFLKPVAQNVGGSASENPVLKALFGGGNTTAKNSTKQFYNWISNERPSINNCHPFKKTELSREIINNGVPVQVPKSLSREREKTKTNTPRTKSEINTKTRDAGSAFKEVSSPSGNIMPATPSTCNPPPVDATLTQKFKKVNSNGKENNSPNSVNSDEVLNETLTKVHARVRTTSLCSIKKMGYVNSEKLMKLRTIVDNAIKNHKVYSMTGCYNSVRNALKQRGWIEKIDSDVKGKRKQNRFEEIGIYDAAFQFVQKYPTVAAMRYSVDTRSGFLHNDQINYSGQGEAEIINRMLRNINEDLCWLSRPYPYYSWKDIGKFDLINRLPKAYFSNKIGLCNSLQHIQWYFEPGVCSTQYPRTYNMSQTDEYDAFKEDFRMTACIGLLKWLTTNYRSGGERAVRSIDGKVDACTVDFALKRCSDYVKYKEHEDIDLPEGPVVWDYQWDHFIAQYYKVINDGQLLKECKNDPSIQVYVTSALAMLNSIKRHWPQMNIDGYQNYWVVKPGGRCCGNGIVIKNNLEQILLLVNPSVSRETRYVVQKYIERPLLIYNTKFDIRQWFLVTNVYPLTVWMYKESYLRFCSQPFSLKNTHESIHLCNNAVQRRYKNSKRDRGLPDENMWDCYTFQTYLKSMGYPDAWEKYIYPGMKEGFIGALLASQDTMERRKNCFELYGADFMISDTLSDGPWLIEINSNPAMDSSTSVTARMCPQVLEDIVKVVIDRRDNKNASTGAFEMVFKQHCPPVPPYLGMSLSIKGQRMSRVNPGESKQSNKKSKRPHSSGKFLQSETEDLLWNDCNNEMQSNCHIHTNNIDMPRKKVFDEESRRDISPTISMELLNGLKKEILRAKMRMAHNRENKKNKEKEKTTSRSQPKVDDIDLKGEKLLPTTNLSILGGNRSLSTLSSRMYQFVSEFPNTYAVNEIPINCLSYLERKMIAGEVDHVEFDENEKGSICPDFGTTNKIMSEMSTEVIPVADKDIKECSSLYFESETRGTLEYNDSFDSLIQNNRDLTCILECNEVSDTSIDGDASFNSFGTPKEEHCESALKDMRNNISLGSSAEQIQVSMDKHRNDVFIEDFHPFLYIKKLDLPYEGLKGGNQSQDSVETQGENIVKDIYGNSNNEKDQLFESKTDTFGKTFRGVIVKKVDTDPKPSKNNTSEKNGNNGKEAKKTAWKKNSLKSNTIRLDQRRRMKLLTKRKIDWVRKNIENIRLLPSGPNSGLTSSKKVTQLRKNTAKGPNNFSPENRVSENNLRVEDYEGMYKEEFLKLFFTLDSKRLIQQLVHGPGKIRKDQKMVKNVTEKRNKYYQEDRAENQNGIDIFTREGKTWKPGHVTMKAFQCGTNGCEKVNLQENILLLKDGKTELPAVCEEIASQLGLGIGKSSDKNDNSFIFGSGGKLFVDNSLMTSNLQCGNSVRVNSCPDIHLNLDNNSGSNIDIVTKGELIRGKSELSLKKDCENVKNETDWKTNVELVRRACNEILSKLKEFNESNSKVRSQQALTKGKDVDNKLSDVLGAYRSAKGLAKVGKSGCRKHLIRSQAQRDSGVTRSRKISILPADAFPSHQDERGNCSERGKRKNEGNFIKCFSSPSSGSNLAINIENGAVRKVQHSIAKVEEWTFPLIDRASGSSFGPSQLFDCLPSKRE